MEPKGSLPHSQASATCPCPGPAKSNPHTHNPPPEDPSPVVSFPPGSPPRRYTPPSPHPYAPHAQPISFFLIFHPHNIGWAVQIIKLLFMQSPPFQRYLVPPRSKYSPQHHILKHPQLPFLSQYQRIKIQASLQTSHTQISRITYDGCDIFTFLHVRLSWVKVHTRDSDLSEVKSVVREAKPCLNHENSLYKK